MILITLRKEPHGNNSLRLISYKLCIGQVQYHHLVQRLMGYSTAYTRILIRQVAVISVGPETHGMVHSHMAAMYGCKLTMANKYI